jgi:hypothetical protein
LRQVGKCDAAIHTWHRTPTKQKQCLFQNKVKYFYYAIHPVIRLYGCANILKSYIAGRFYLHDCNIFSLLQMQGCQTDVYRLKLVLFGWQQISIATGMGWW